LSIRNVKLYCKDALEDHKFLTREEIDKLWWNLLSDVLSDKQKKAKVGNMLTKMREERIIVNETKGNVSVWSLLKTKK
jgi:ATP-dependent DNA helicase RecG